MGMGADNVLDRMAASTVRGVLASSCAAAESAEHRRVPERSEGGVLEQWFSITR